MPADSVSQFEIAVGRCDRMQLRKFLHGEVGTPEATIETLSCRFQRRACTPPHVSVKETTGGLRFRERVVLCS